MSTIYTCGPNAKDEIDQITIRESGMVIRSRNHIVTGTGAMTKYNIFTSSSNDSDSYNITEGITELGDGCLSKHTIKDISLPNSLIKIGSSCFKLSSITYIKLPSNLEEMGHDNFPSSLELISLPASLRIFPTDNIGSCKKLTAICVHKDNKYFKSIDGILYNYDVTEILICPRGKAGKVIIPPSVKHIADYCFNECNKISSIEMPHSIETIGSYAFSRLSLDHLVVPNNVSSIGDACFLRTTIRNKFKLSQRITILPNSCFKHANILNTDFLINIEEIGDNCFECIKSKDLPSNLRLPKVKKIGMHAFDSVKKVKSIELPSCIQHIGKGAFASTADDLKIIFLSVVPLSIGDNAFYDLSNKATLYVPAGSKIIFEHLIPWSTFSQIEEFDLEKDINNEDGTISDEHLFFRLKNIASSFDNADRYYLKETLEDIAMYYQNVNNEDVYNEAIQLIQFNRRFNPPLVPDLEKVFFTADWRNKYRLKFANYYIMNIRSSSFSLQTQEINQQNEGIAKDETPLLEYVKLLEDIELLAQESVEDVEIHFYDILRHLQNELSLTTKSIKIAVSWFTNRALFDQIKEFAKKGLSVQLIINNDLINRSGYCLNFNELIAAGGHISLVEYPHMVHHKFCIIDDNVVINGSYNWTRFSEKNYENIVIFRNNDEIYEDFNEEFENMLSKAEHKDVKTMPDNVPLRSEYDRSAFKQYITEELDAEARQTSNQRDKITALQKASKLNPQYLEKINPEAKKKYEEEFKVIEQSESITKAVVEMVKKNQPSSKKTNDSQEGRKNTKSSTITPVKAKSLTSPIKQNAEQEKEIIQHVKASSMLMVLDVSGSMKKTYAAGHVTNIAKKSLSAALTLSDTQTVSIWEFGSDANYIDEIGIANITAINKIHCKNQGTYLQKFVSKADSSIKENAFIIVFTDDDGNSIRAAVPGMKARKDVFWQIIVYGNHSEITNAIKGISNISLVSMTDYESKSDEEITQALLKDYINWKNNLQ